MALYGAIQTCHESVEWLARQVTGFCLDIVSQRPVPIPSPLQVDARPGHLSQDPGKIFASISGGMMTVFANMELATTIGGHYCCSDIGKPQLLSSFLVFRNGSQLRNADQCELSQTIKT